MMVNKIDRPNTTPIGVYIVDLQSLALTSISFNDLPFLHERIERCHSATRIFLRLGTDGRYSVTNGKIVLCD